MCIGRSLDPVTGYVLVLYSTVKLAMFAFLSCMTGFHKGLLMGDATFCIMKEKEMKMLVLATAAMDQHGKPVAFGPIIHEDEGTFQSATEYLVTFLHQQTRLCRTLVTKVSS